MFGPASGGVPDVRLTFEAIVEVGMATAEPLHEARRQVEREEEDTPALVLFHVDVLVETSSPQRVVIDADDHMTERDCGEAKWHRQQADEALDRSASHFQGAVDEMKLGAGSQREKGKRDPHDCRRKRPDVPGYRAHPAHGLWNAHVWQASSRPGPLRSRSSDVATVVAPQVAFRRVCKSSGG